MKSLMRQEPLEIFCLENLPQPIDPVRFFPTKTELHQGQAFDKDNPYELYSVKPILSNIAVII